MARVSVPVRPASSLRGGTKRDTNDLVGPDALAIELGCGYVARSFSGDMKQLLALIKGAIAHRGTALLDVISPCVTFNNHEDSTKSYKWAKDHEEPIQEIGFIPYFEEIFVDALNFPPDHPAREMQDTFFVAGPGGATLGFASKVTVEPQA